MNDHPDTIPGDGSDDGGGGIASIAGGAAGSSDGGAGAIFGRGPAASGERSDSLLVPDLARPDGPQPDDPAQAQAGETTGGSFLSPAAGDGVSPV